MSETALRRTDRLAQALLLLWAGGGLCFGALAPLLFALIPSRDLAGSVAGAMVGRLDTLAWVAFGLSLALVFGLRWLNEIDEALPLTPAKLWAFAAMVALILCLISSGLIHPRLLEQRAQMGGAIEAFAKDHPLRAAYDKNHRLSTVVFFLRLGLALVMAFAIDALPIQRSASVEA